jgi:5'(3')-deoxyribonucleotidase
MIGYKSMRNCDYLIDDSSRHIEFFSAQGYLSDAPHNQNERQYKRGCNWQEIKTLLS